MVMWLKRLQIENYKVQFDDRKTHVVASKSVMMESMTEFLIGIPHCSYWDLFGTWDWTWFLLIINDWSWFLSIRMRNKGEKILSDIQHQWRDYIFWFRILQPPKSWHHQNIETWYHQSGDIQIWKGWICDLIPWTTCSSSRAARGNWDWVWLGSRSCAKCWSCMDTMVDVKLMTLMDFNWASFEVDGVWVSWN